VSVETKGNTDRVPEGALKEPFIERWNSMVSRALGEEMRSVREARGWSRHQLADRLPSGIGERTVLAYEHGSRQLTAVRFIEICGVLEVDPATLMQRALQRARINLESLTIRINLHALLIDESVIYRPMMQWARNTLNQNSGGIVEVEPVVVKHLAAFVGCSYLGLAKYLSRFAPGSDIDSPAKDSRKATKTSSRTTTKR
jgi:transcriptional regulator with XRE-family HTH domain